MRLKRLMTLSILPLHLTHNTQYLFCLVISVDALVERAGPDRVLP